MEFEAKVLGTLADPTISLVGDLTAPHAFPLKVTKDHRSITFEMDGFTRMNSIGVRQWDQWMAALRAANPKLVIKLVNIPYFFVELFNVIHEFVPRPYVVNSFYLQYYCDSCEKPVDVLVSGQSGAFPKSVKDLPAMNCDVCQSQLQMDFVSDRIFFFLEKSGAV